MARLNTTTITSIEQYPKLLASLQKRSDSENWGDLRNLLRTDLYFLLRYGLGRDDVEHQWLLDRCNEVSADPDGRLDLWAREHYKSTIITFALTIQDILASHGENPLIPREQTFGIFSHTRPIAKGFLRQIKRELESNSYLKHFFPDILYENPAKEAPKWSEDDGLVVKRKGNPKESTVEAWGLVDGQPTSKHFTTLIFDDIVTLESSRSGAMIRKTTEALELAYNLGTDGGAKRFIGTIYDDADTWSVIKERKTAIPRVYACTDDGTAEGRPLLMSEAYLAEKRRDMGPYSFSCQMLLDPIPSGDSYFRREDFIIEQELPGHLNLYGCSDYAVTEGGGDFTEHGVFGVDTLGRPWVVDWWSGQSSADTWIESQIDLMADHTPYVWVGESGPIRRAVEPFLRKRMQARNTYCRLEWLPSITDKATRCRPFQAMVAHHGLRILAAPWNGELISQLMRFPKSSIDDKVDTCSLFGRALQETWAATVPTKEPIEKDAWGRRFREEASWKTV